MPTLLHLGDHNRHPTHKDNLVADTLSRAIINNIQLVIDYHDVATAQKQDSKLQASHTATCTSSLKLQDIPFGTKSITILCDISTGYARPTVLTEWRHKILTWLMAYKYLIFQYELQGNSSPQSLHGMVC